MTISIFVPESADVATEHRFAQRTNFIAVGDQTTAPTLDVFFTQSITSSLWLAEVDALRATAIDVVVAFGDSITDGNNSTEDANMRYPDQLSELLQDAGTSNPEVAVANAGIGGNRWLHGGLGPAGIERFAHDVIKVSGVSTVVMLMGINDIGFGQFSEDEAVTADQLSSAISKAAAQARAKGIRVYLGTLLPFRDSLYYSDEGEATRGKLNSWILANREVEGTIDFDALIRDPMNPTAYNPDYDSGDHLHPNDQGYAAMAEAVRRALKP